MITPTFIGQRYKDTNTGNIWKSNSLTPGDWTMEVQNMGWKWTPHSAKLGDNLGSYAFTDIPSIASLIYEEATSVNGFDIEAGSSLTSVTFPNLTSITGGKMLIWTLPNVTEVSAPLLVSTSEEVDLSDIALLSTLNFNSLVTVGTFFSLGLPGTAPITTLSLPVFTTAPQGVFISGVALTTVSMPVYIPTNGKQQDFSFGALNASSVNHVLARCVANAGYVSGGVKLNGGTNAAPTGQGIVDKATLNARLAGLAVTN